MVSVLDGRCRSPAVYNGLNLYWSCDYSIPILLDRWGRGAGVLDEGVGRGLCCRSNWATLVISASLSNDVVALGRVGRGRSRVEKTAISIRLSPLLRMKTYLFFCRIKYTRSLSLCLMECPRMEVYVGGAPVISGSLLTGVTVSSL